MPATVLFLIALLSGGAGAFITWRLSSLRPGEAGAVAAGRKLGGEVRRHPALAAALGRRLDPEALTGLALSIALLFTAAAGVVLGLLASLVRTNGSLAAIDDGAARWAERHASPPSTRVLDAVTQLGSIYVVVGLAFALVAAELYRVRTGWVVPFVVAVVGGEELLATLIKQIVDRARPAFNPAAASLGPSFPSGHTTTAAAFYAAAALLLGRRRPRLARAGLNGGAFALAAAVGASRVLLDLHWLTDVVGGLALGFAWFALCAIAFGGRVLRFGVVAEIAQAEVSPERSRLGIDRRGERASIAQGKV